MRNAPVAPYGCRLTAQAVRCALHQMGGGLSKASASERSTHCCAWAAPASAATIETARRRIMAWTFGLGGGKYESSPTPDRVPNPIWQNRWGGIAALPLPVNLRGMPLPLRRFAQGLPRAVHDRVHQVPATDCPRCPGQRTVPATPVSND